MERQDWDDAPTDRWPGCHATKLNSDHQISPTQPMPRRVKAAPTTGSTSGITAAERFWWYNDIVECRAKQSPSSRVSVAHHLTPGTHCHPDTLGSERAARQAYSQPNISFLTICNSMARRRQSFGKRGQPEEWYPQAAAHFRGCAKASFLQEAEFVKKGSSWTFTPKKIRTSSAQAKESTTRLAAQSSNQKSTKNIIGTRTSVFTTDLGPLQQWRSIQAAYGVALQRVQHRINFNHRGHR